MPTLPRGRRARVSPMPSIQLLPRLLWLLPALVLAACGGSAVPTPTAVPLPVATPVPPRPTAVPLTATPMPPSATLVPPTATPVPPPTATPAPPTATPGPPPSVAVLAYHHFGVPEAGDYNCTLDAFEDQLRWLHKHGYQSVLPQQLVDALHGKAALPEHPVVFTFDDNNAEQYTDAAPLLEKYGFRGAFFIDTVTIGKDYFMSSAELRDLEARGHVIGSHTWDHRDLAILTLPEVQHQLDLSEADLVRVLGHKPAFISYPFGTYNEALVAELQARGYQGGFRLRDPDQPQVDPAFMIHRQIIPGAWSLDDFVAQLHSMED